MQEAFGLWSCINEQARTESKENQRMDRMNKNTQKFRSKREKKLASGENIKRNNYFVKPKKIAGNLVMKLSNE